MCVTFYIPKELIKEIYQMSKDENRTQNKIVSDLLREGLKHYGRKEE